MELLRVVRWSISCLRKSRGSPICLKVTQRNEEEREKECEVSRRTINKITRGARGGRKVEKCRGKDWRQKEASSWKGERRMRSVFFSAKSLWKRNIPSTPSRRPTEASEIWLKSQAVDLRDRVKFNCFNSRAITSRFYRRTIGESDAELKQVSPRGSLPSKKWSFHVSFYDVTLSCKSM